MEKMIALTASLPRNSTTRKKLTGIVIDTLWTSLQHPPMSYMGDKFSYRTPDGSFNVGTSVLPIMLHAYLAAESTQSGPWKGW